MPDVVITIIAHGPDEIGERETVLPPSTTNGIVEHLLHAGLTLDDITVAFPDADGEEPYCGICGHAEWAHDEHGEVDCDLHAHTPHPFEVEHDASR